MFDSYSTPAAIDFRDRHGGGLGLGTEIPNGMSTVTHLAMWLTLQKEWLAELEVETAVVDTGFANPLLALRH